MATFLEYWALGFALLAALELLFRNLGWADLLMIAVMAPFWPLILIFEAVLWWLTPPEYRPTLRWNRSSVDTAFTRSRRGPTT